MMLNFLSRFLHSSEPIKHKATGKAALQVTRKLEFRKEKPLKEKAMKLISTTEFVFELSKQSSSFGINSVIENYGKIINYTLFVKTKAKLGIFVPCDDNGNVLIEPEQFKEWIKSDHYFNASESVCHDCRMFKKAKERVLLVKKKPASCMVLQSLAKPSPGSKDFLDNLEKMTIEDFAKYGYYLTDTAKNRIGC